METRGRKAGSGVLKDSIPKTCVTGEMLAAVQYLMDKYGMSKSNAIRHLMDNGIIYMAMFGDGVVEDK
jgi:hypothetical protein